MIFFPEAHFHSMIFPNLNQHRKIGKVRFYEVFIYPGQLHANENTNFGKRLLVLCLLLNKTNML